MKNTLVRCFVLVLAVTGFTATSFSAPKAPAANKTTATILTPSIGSPTPLCWPDGKHFCGMD